MRRLIKPSTLFIVKKRKINKFQSSFTSTFSRVLFFTSFPVKNWKTRFFTLCFYWKTRFFTAKKYWKNLILKNQAFPFSSGFINKTMKKPFFILLCFLLSLSLFATERKNGKTAFLYFSATGVTEKEIREWKGIENGKLFLKTPNTFRFSEKRGENPSQKEGVLLSFFQDVTQKIQKIYYITEHEYRSLPVFFLNFQKKGGFE